MSGVGWDHKGLSCSDRFVVRQTPQVIESTSDLVADPLL